MTLLPSIQDVGLTILSKKAIEPEQNPVMRFDKTFEIHMRNEKWTLSMCFVHMMYHRKHQQKKTTPKPQNHYALFGLFGCIAFKIYARNTRRKKRTQNSFGQSIIAIIKCFVIWSFISHQPPSVKISISHLYAAGNLKYVIAYIQVIFDDV